jgi:hypothetical protein
MSIVDWAGASDGPPVSEATPLEPRADERGAYTHSKLEAEKRVVAAAEAGKVPAVILRPGQIFGGGIPLLTGAVWRVTWPGAGSCLAMASCRCPWCTSTTWSMR